MVLPKPWPSCWRWHHLLTTSTVQSLDAGAAAAAAWDYKMQLESGSGCLHVIIYKQKKNYSSGWEPKCTGSACLCVSMWHISVKHILELLPLINRIDWMNGWLIYLLIDWLDWWIDWAIVRASVQLAFPPCNTIIEPTGNTTHAAHKIKTEHNIGQNNGAWL